MKRVWHGFVIAVATLIFGVMAIIGCLIIPNGNPLIWCARPWAATILAACGVRVRARGGAAPGRPVLYMTNHQSHFDVLALIRSLPGQYRVIAKKELFSIPVFGWAISLAGFIGIDRDNREAAFQSLDRAAEKIRSGLSVVIFAEGTRSPDGRLLPFKKGGFMLALRSGAPVVPVTISGSRAVLARDSLDIRPGAIDVVFGAPVDTTAYSLETRDALMAAVRRGVEEGFTGLRDLDLAAQEYDGGGDTKDAGSTAGGSV
jgi:1-acyl-sn-glycerol-3-phosphate acyltransferase